MSEDSRKVALPAYLPRRLDAFRVTKGDTTTYILRDKLQGRTHDLEPWQFFVLEVLPGCETIEKLLSVFEDRFGRPIENSEVFAFFGWLADNALLEKDAASHPLLKPFTQRKYAVEQGLVRPKSFEELAAMMAPQPSKGDASGKGSEAAPGDAELPAGVSDADNLDPRRSRRVIELFPLKGLLDVALPVLAPLKWGIYLLPFLALGSVLLVVQYWYLLEGDLKTLGSMTTLVTHVVFSMFTVNLAATLTLAVIAHNFRATVGRLGIGFFLGFLPRFVVRIGNTQQLSRRERIWLHAGPLLVRVLLFSSGVLLWYNLRNVQSDLWRAGMALAFISGVNLLVASGNPLVRGNAYHLLAAVMDERHLRGKAYRALMERLRGGGAREADSNVLAGYALATFLYAYLVAVLATLLVLHFLQTVQIGGAAVILAAALGVYLTFKAVNRVRRINQAYDRAVQFERWRKRTMPAEEGEAVQVEPTSSRTSVYLRRTLAVTLLLALFLPYPYEPGGRFKIFPSDRQVLTSDISGVIEEVNFDGGESVRKGTVIARIASTDLKAQASVLTARIAEQHAVIKDLKSRPKAEEVELARRALEVAQKREEFSNKRVPRLENLHRDRVISFEELDAARKEHEVDMQEVARAEAALALAKVGATPDRIAAEQAKLESLVEERKAVEGKIQRTVMVMPFDGTLLTLHLRERLNAVLDKGQPFAVVEATRSVSAEIEVPESDIGYVRIGAPIRARPNAYFDRDFDGVVQTIDRNVTTESFGSVVKVIAVIENPGGELRTGMTGYGKVDGVRMPLWKAFSLGLLRFFNVQVWAWIP